MKKAMFLMILPVILLLCGCQTTEYYGIENFSSFESSMEFNYNLLPGNEDFLDIYPYQNGDYYCYFDDHIWNIKIKSIVTLTYDSETYLEAKNHCITAFQFDPKPYRYNNYTIYERNYNSESFTQEIRMFGFDDTAQCLVFFAYLDTKDKDKTVVLSDFKIFFEKGFQSSGVFPS